ncbi:MAG TPA: BON domain-containing protein [Pyrinomonadaceae bacterium]|jgi:osmotically-inducible protein OsmY|nr:BON domain-containing protein [Pyrinomonadaceae bacterium]
MRKKAALLVALVFSFGAIAACNETTTNTNSNGNTNANRETIGTRTEPTATATPTPGYSEEQAREERERAKANKETIGQSIEDAWVHTKLVTKLIGDTQTPERKINVDVVEGAVTLRGQVDTADAKAEAERLAKDTDGVKSVKNELKVVPAKAGNSNSNKSTMGNSNKSAKSKTSY